MRPTRRYWELIGVGLLLLGSAIVFDQPALLVGTAGMLGYLLAIQIAFVHTLGALDESLAVEQSLERTATMIDEPLPVTLRSRGEAEGVTVTVSLQPSAGLEVDGTEAVPLGETAVPILSSAIAGTHTLFQPTVTVDDTYGVFSERLARGSEREFTVQPREPTQVHIGEGGDAVPVSFGEHTAGSGESGLTPAEIREYTGEESVSQIDWKATARLQTPHIREFETESNLTTILIVDRRERLASGPPGETAFDYLRSAVLSYLTVLESIRDPVGCFIVSDGHTTQPITPTNSSHGYESIRRRFRTMCVETTNTAGGRRTRSESIRQRAPMLDRETKFGRTLARYTETVVATAETEPLRSAVRRATKSRQEAVQIALFTDDSDHAELRNVVAEAERANARLRLFIAPRCLYQTGAGVDNDVAHDRYREFERFRRKLAAIDGVQAYEVTPRERIERLLETQRPAGSSPKTTGVVGDE